MDALFVQMHDRSQATELARKNIKEERKMKKGKMTGKGKKFYEAYGIDMSTMQIVARVEPLDRQPELEARGIAYMPMTGLLLTAGRAMTGDDCVGWEAITVEEVKAKGYDVEAFLQQAMMASWMQGNVKRFVDVALEKKWDIYPGGGVPMWIVSNKSYTYGAIQIFNPIIVKRLMGVMGGKAFAAIPSSVHEFLAVPYEGELGTASLIQMVREVNRAIVAPEERLSDNVYVFKDKGDGFEVTVATMR